jgi:N-acetylglucosamine-6-phosphate deacetylase
MTESPALPGTWRGPGLVDLQVNGCAGFDFNAPAEEWSAEGLERVRLALARRGIAAALPTLITDEARAMLARARRWAALLEGEPALAAVFPRLHIEGPFLSPEDGPRGAHPRLWCRTPRELPRFLDDLQEASSGRVGILTIAPELPGAVELISRAAGQGICVALGHTQASAETIRAAVEAGARMSTHLGNGSHQLLPRLDNYVQVQLAEDRLAASFIADGHHIPFSTLKNFLRAKTPARSILVSDAIAAADVGPGRYPVGGKEVLVSPDLRVSSPGEPNLAGSALTLDRAVINVARECGLAFEQAWEMASLNPSALLGLPPPPPVAVAIRESGFSRQA